jgi:hypothetical protein
MGSLGKARAGRMARAMQDRDGGTIMRQPIEKGPEITIPPAFAGGRGEGPAKGHSGSSEVGQ